MRNTHSLDQARTLVGKLAGALGADLIETHISWVLLAGDSAYKIKKPVSLPFVDYTALQARRHFCEEELRLNRRLAPALYLGLARITGTLEAPLLDASGPTLEYAVHMRRFPKGALFAEQLTAGTLPSLDVDSLADLLADFHNGQPPAEPATGFASAEARHMAAQAALRGALAVASPAEQTQLRDWLESEAAGLQALWTQRRLEGRVRECHGDLHLDNVVSLEGGVAAFDGIEFDPALRWIDVIDDIAFPVMDFMARGRTDFAFRLLNRWLDGTGDHDGLPALRFSLVYRALVRAQVEHLNGAGHEAAARRYLDTALALAQPGQPRLLITHGLPGSGKTFASQKLLEREGAIRLRSDVERKRLAGLGMLADSRASGLDLYQPETTARTYAQLFRLARGALAAGWPVILDAAFLRRAERAQALALAGALGVPFSIIDCQAPPQVLRERLQARRGDASEATVEVIDHLSVSAEPLTTEELRHVLPASGH
ncbi:bifunctional aminoglycoside phosphotransferase/ATP-binding protein [Polaromonas glacialis]|uniref:bifunctional aminoglycoside phosphotransferase/ATP-binding protein n=1 Tax=Polaromonas glacialis TaxID=866564 RepID=UPI000561E8C9|nr:bifunctional aminoglycoside phosphotransferase/ATP-binding protein [Polaromonas glacialis]